MARRTPARILVVDDDAELLAAYQDALADSGYEVATAASGEQARALSRSWHPDLLLTDIVMPGMDGFELIERLRVELKSEAPPAIVCSGFQITEAEALRRGARLFLPKPASVTALRETIDAVLEGKLPQAESVACERNRSADERQRARLTSDARLALADQTEEAALVQGWLEWLTVYLDCAGAAAFVLRQSGIELLASAGFPVPDAPEAALLRANIAEMVETRTTLVVGNMRAHQSFRRVLPARFEVGFFAGVPLLTPDDVAVGALCVADVAPRRFDAESLALLEYCGRRHAWHLFEQRRTGSGPRANQAPLMQQTPFETALATELRIANRLSEAVELALVELPPDITPQQFAVRLWSACAGPRVGIGSTTPGRVGFFKRGPPAEASRHVAVAVEVARAQGLLSAAGVVSVSGAAGLTDGSIIRLAERALSAARDRGSASRVERTVVRPER